MKSKVRIQLLTPEGGLISDRLVDQTTEFYTGPKEKHDGPIRIEFNLTCGDEVEKSITYLQKLTGLLPIAAKVTTTSAKAAESDLPDDRKAMVAEFVNKAKDQDSFITELRKLDYRFVNSEMLKTMVPPKYKIKERHYEKYDWLIRRMREAKDPRNDRFDLTVIIGIVIMDKRDPRMVVYLFGEFEKSYKLAIPEKNPMTQKQTNLIKYPHYMVYAEREKWGIEHRTMLIQPEKKATKFYKRWVRDVKVPDELKLDPPYEKR